MTNFDTWNDVRSRRPTTPQRRASARRELENQIVSYQLSELRKQQGLTQQQVAVGMGVSQRRVSAIERGEVDHSELATLRAYVQALGGSISVIVDVDGTVARIG